MLGRGPLYLRSVGSCILAHLGPCAHVCLSECEMLVYELLSGGPVGAGVCAQGYSVQPGVPSPFCCLRGSGSSAREVSLGAWAWEPFPGASWRVLAPCLGVGATELRQRRALACLFGGRQLLARGGSAYVYEWPCRGGQGVSPCLWWGAGSTIWAAGGVAVRQGAPSPPPRQRMSVCVCPCAHRWRKVGWRLVCPEVCVCAGGGQGGSLFLEGVSAYGGIAPGRAQAVGTRGEGCVPVCAQSCE